MGAITGNDDVVNALIEALKDDGRFQAGSLSQRAAIFLLTPGTTSTITMYFHECAARALGELGDMRAWYALAQATKSENESLKGNAKRALKQIEKKCENRGISSDEKAIAPIIRTLKDDDWEVRSKSAEVLGKIGDPKAVEPLIQALKDNVGNIDYNAANALEKIGKPATKSLIKHLRDQNPIIREKSAMLLGTIGDNRATKSLIFALKDKNPNVRKEVARALGKIGDARALPAISNATKDEKWGVRQAAKSALKKIKINRKG
jgi:HEAT repeat protein